MPEKIRFLLTGLTLCSAAVIGPSTLAEQSNYSPFTDRHFPQNVYWGDTHLHTSMSIDAYTFGGRLGLEEAYRFARGEQVEAGSGQPVRLVRPLDFIVIADHAEYLGAFELITEKNPVFAQDSVGRQLLNDYESRGVIGVFERSAKKMGMSIGTGEAGRHYGPELGKLTWERSTSMAGKYNDPGRFTAFIGYEYSPTPEGDNLHRVVVFGDDAAKAQQVVPFSAADSLNPERLWQFLANYERNTGGRVLAIPHNGNASGGLMFADRTFAGGPLSRAYAETRARWEPLYEVTQIKGDGEAHPMLSPDDRFADYESWDTANLGRVLRPMTMERLSGEYARSALKKGMLFEASLGVNPFKFGMIGSSDAHTSLAAVREDNFFGKFTENEPSPGRAGKHEVNPEVKVKVEHIPTGADFVSSGYAAVWAHENTRESLFDAMQRREVYATTGTRMTVRFFGGWDFSDQDDKRPDYVATGYDKGVPMGGDLAAAPEGQSPKFLVIASKDAEGANLDRIQIVKGWLDDRGNTHERVYDVALSDNREVGRKGTVEALESTVDIQTATYTNTVGEPVLSTVWEDPDFVAAQRSFYYVRVLEIPTPRWTTYDAVFFNAELPADVPAEIQERAYTSPIWYTP